ncbi:hypothetical protein VitviT2T_005817 [Vitis vinifera]|uniref:HMG box domain-containing protein n=2 Tax=Vitis vinifera TaxID=29760 RepID=A0ABY9BU59_VITVI|nr:hypothetical protein VitviT2T_005817 [Vitis vinifera]
MKFVVVAISLMEFDTCVLELKPAYISIIPVPLSLYEALTPPGNSPPPPLTQSVFTGFRRFSADSHRFRRVRRCCVAGFAMKGGKSKAAEVKRADSNARLSVKKKGAAAVGKKTAKKEKAVKDPNKPKRPASAFFVFMEEFRKQYKEKHPANKSVSVVGKAGGDKWKSLSEAEKAPYVAKAEKRKTEYNKSMQAYNKRMAEGPTAAEEEESDKSRSEVNDDEEDEDESGEEEDDEE